MKRLLLGGLLILAAGGLSAADLNPKMAYLTDGDAGLVNMSSDLLQARLEVRKGASARAVLDQFPKHAIRNGKLQCIISVDAITPEIIDQVKSQGLQIVGTYDLPGDLHHIVVHATNPLQFDSIARSSGVRAVVVEPEPTLHVGAVTSQADSAIGAATARTNFSVDGTGLRVGVLSDSVHDVIGGTLSGGFLTGSSSQGTGDLPASLRVIDAGPGGGTDEGAGMAELVYDLAPGADISFASAFSGYSAFASNITALATDAGLECDVICDDVSYSVEPVYQDGPIALAAQNAVDSGIPYYSSAGNQTDDGHERPYTDANSGTDDLVFPPTGNDLHDFGLAMGLSSDTHLQFTLANGEAITLGLHWTEPYGGTYGAGPGSEADYDLYIVNSATLPVTNPMVLAASTNVQGTSGSPSGPAFEGCSYQNTTGSPQTVYVIIDHYDGKKDDDIHLWVKYDGSGGIDDKVLLTDRTLFGHAAAPGAIATGAMLYFEISTGGNAYAPNGVLNVNSFSSLGGDLPFYFDSTGALLGTVETRAKPEVTGPDGADTTFFGSGDWDSTSFPNFWGTSAAAPHVAAVAALMLERNAALTPANLNQILINTAVDAETAGWDSLSGHGVVDALAAVTNAVSTPPTVTIDENASQDDPTNTLPIVFDVVFSEDVTGFTGGADVSFSGTASGITYNITGGPASYQVNVTAITSPGTVIASIPSSAANSVGTGLGNTASSSTDNSVTYDNVSPTMDTLQAAAGQADPATTLPINFTVDFDEAINGFDASDVDTSASTASGTLTVGITPSSRGTSGPFTVSVDGAAGAGDITISIIGGGITDDAGNTVNASGSATVTYNPAAAVEEWWVVK
ncbi:S8 family serine peptidase [bacterium]|nr:S8 family serine peptidase [bacterium]